jgi:hypothetical protein
LSSVDGADALEFASTMEPPVAEGVSLATSLRWKSVAAARATCRKSLRCESADATASSHAHYNTT